MECMKGWHAQEERDTVSRGARTMGWVALSSAVCEEAAMKNAVQNLLCRLGAMWKVIRR